MIKRAWLAVFFIVLSFGGVRPAYTQKINFIKDLSIKSDENDEQKSFLMVEGVDSDSQGNIYALAAREYKIQVYSAKGEYLRTIGKKGQGPGELEMALYILLDKEDNLYVFDFMKSAFVVFVLVKRIEMAYLFHFYDRAGNFVEELNRDFLPWIYKNGYVYTMKASQDFSECEVIRFKPSFK